MDQSPDSASVSPLTSDQRKEFRDYLWKYFALHADQRLKTFNFFVVVAAAIIAGYLNLATKDNPPPWASALPFLLSLTSYSFWKLDVRTKLMIKGAESGLKLLDAQSNLPPGDAFLALRVFELDDTLRKTSPLHRSGFLNGQLSYSKCFNLMFIAFGLLGLLIGLLDIIKVLA